MKRLSILLFIFCFYIENVEAQTPAVDVLVPETLLALGIAEEGTFDNIDDSQNEIKKTQAAITLTMERIRQMEEKVTNYLQQANETVVQGQNIIYASNIITDVVEYQKRAYNIAKDNVEYMPLVTKMQLNLVLRAQNIMKKIYDIAIKNGEKNMLNTKQRTDLINSVVNELRIMRGLSYAICTKLEAAVRAGIIKSYLPKEYDWYTQNKKIAEQILDKTLKKIK
jgi:hypothetical protein